MQTNPWVITSFLITRGSGARKNLIENSFEKEAESIDERLLGISENMMKKQNINRSMFSWIFLYVQFESMLDISIAMISHVREMQFVIEEGMIFIFPLMWAKRREKGKGAEILNKLNSVNLFPLFILLSWYWKSWRKREVPYWIVKVKG